MLPAREIGSHREALRRRVCSICLDADDDGRCTLAGAPCAMFDRYDALTTAVRDLLRRGDSGFLAAIERDVCPGCPQHAPDGACLRREQGRCAVSVYLPLIVEAFQQSG